MVCICELFFLIALLIPGKQIFTTFLSEIDVLRAMNIFNLQISVLRVL